jgi:hypothetical protein
MNEPSFTEHPIFHELLSYMYLSPSGASDRIQLRRKKMTSDFKRSLHSVQTPCVSCGEYMFPLRGNGRYFAATCALEDRVACSRTAAASLEYHKVAKAIRARA